MAVVSAATGVMNSLLAKLSNLLTDEYKLLKGVRKDVQFLKDELSTMNALLLKLADMDELDAQTKEWRNKVREMSYDIEDCIDLFKHHLDNRDDDNTGLIQKLVRWLKELMERHQIAGQIQELKSLVKEESDRRKRYALGEHTTSTSSVVPIDPRVLAIHEETKDLVGIDGQKDEVIKLLRDEKKQLKVVCIVGCGGLGKTTLATKVYHDIGGEFQCRASTSVSRTPDKKIFKDILSQIYPKEHHHLFDAMEVDQLIRKLQQCLKDKSCLPLQPSSMEVKPHGSRPRSTAAGLLPIEPTAAGGAQRPSPTAAGRAPRRWGSHRLSPTAAGVGGGGGAEMKGGEGMPMNSCTMARTLVVG